MPIQDSSQEVHPLKQIRLLLGLTQAQFARLLGVEVTTVSRWETRQREASFSLAQTALLDKALAEHGRRISEFVPLEGT